MYRMSQSMCNMYRCEPLLVMFGSIRSVESSMCGSMSERLLCSEPTVLVMSPGLSYMPRYEKESMGDEMMDCRCFFSLLGPTDEDCQACSAGFLFNDKDRKCLSLCPNGNYFDQGEQKCKLCADNCLECYSPGTHCRQCTYPLSLNMITHHCSSCCTSNITTAKCCQCSSSWDGRTIALALVYLQSGKSSL